MSVDGFEKDSKLLAASQEELRPICDGTAGGGELPRSGRGAAPERSAASTGARPPEPDQAPASGITGASTSQGEKFKGNGGVDWLQVRCFGNWDEEKFAKLANQLETAKQEAQNEKCGGLLDHPDGGIIVVQAKGYRSGTISVEWSIEFDGIGIGITREPVAYEFTPNVLVTMTSMILMQRGHIVAWEMCCRALASLGYRIENAVPTRCDICVDMTCQHIEEYFEKYETESYICRARKDKVFRNNRRVTGIAFGDTPSCRIYDKIEECIDQPQKFPVLIAYRWGGQLPEAAIRVEFQFRRESLRERWSVSTVNDLFDKLPAIAREMTHEWLRFAEHPVDRQGNHQTRSVEWCKWRDVQTMFCQVFEKNGVAAPRHIPSQPDITRLVEQAFGCLASAAGCVEFRPQNAKEFIRWIEGRFRPLLNGNGMEKLDRRIHEVRARNPIDRDHLGNAPPHFCEKVAPDISCDSGKAPGSTQSS